MYIKCKNRAKDGCTGTAACVQVKLELGHKATIRSKPTAEGFTHDWTVFVRGPESYNVQHFVEKVVFNLHESFPKPKRVVKEAPYQVSESGYAGFVLPIDVHFKNKEEPKKIRFDYDLFLHLEGPPVNHIRCEKLTFQNPTEDFRRKLIKSGGVGILGPDGGTVLGQQGPGGATEEVSTGDIVHQSSQVSKSKSSPDVMRKHKSTSAGKVQETKPAVTASTTSTPVVSEPFVALFGQPIKTNKPSPDSKKNKDSVGRSSSSSKSSKSGSSSSSKERIPSPSTNSREGKTSGLKDGKTPAKENINKTGGKRPPLPPPSLPSSASSSDSKSTNKENKGSTMKRPPSPLTPPPSDSSSKEGKKRKSSSSSSSKKSREKHQTEKKSEKVKDKDKKKDGVQSGSHTKVPKEQDTKNVQESSSKPKSAEKESKSSTKKKASDETASSKPKFHKETSLDSTKSAVIDNSSKSSKPSIIEQRHSNSSSLDASPDSSISFSSLQISGKRGPLGALMAELDDQDDDDELVSPLSSDPPSPPHFSSQDPPAVKVEPMELSPRREKPKSTKHSKSTKRVPTDSESVSRDKLNSSSDSSSSLQNLPVGTCESDLNKLVALQRHLMLLTDRDLVQKVVDLIEETCQYSVSSSSFDFDLCALDKETLNKIYVCLGKPESATS